MGDLPESMPAAVYRSPGVVTVEERPVPVPGPDQVLLKVEHCGICGSDIHMLLEGWGDKPGLIAGHEVSGVVAALGPKVSGWEPGEAVVVGPSPRCGRCRRCREGKPSQCERRGHSISDASDGAFAGYSLANAASLVRIPPGLSEREAALAEPLAVALHGITRSGVGPGDAAMVIGAGPIGALTLAVLVARGITPVTVVEPGRRRQELARRLGATEVLDPSALEEFPMWEPERLSERAVQVVLECSGKRPAIEAGFNQLGRGGTLVMVGAGMEAPRFDPNRMLLNELTVCGSFVYDADGFERALELLASGALPNDRLIEPEDVSLDAIADTLVELAEGRLPGKVMVDPRLGPDGSA